MLTYGKLFKKYSRVTNTPLNYSNNKFSALKHSELRTMAKNIFSIDKNAISNKYVRMDTATLAKEVYRAVKNL